MPSGKGVGSWSAFENGLEGYKESQLKHEWWYNVTVRCLATPTHLLYAIYSSTVFYLLIYCILPSFPTVLYSIYLACCILSSFIYCLLCFIYV